MKKSRLKPAIETAVGHGYLTAVRCLKRKSKAPRYNPGYGVPTCDLHCSYLIITRDVLAIREVVRKHQNILL